MRELAALAVLLAACGGHGETRGASRCMPRDELITVPAGRLAVTTRVAGGTLDGVDADVVLVLGGLGDDAATVSRSMRMLEASGKTVLVLPGGEDAPLPAAHGRVRDLSGVAAVRIGNATLLPVPGAPPGQALANDRCGFTQGDLDRRGGVLGTQNLNVGGIPEPQNGRRVLVSWAMPAGPLGTPGLEGVDAGDAALAAFARRVHATAALYAYPYEALGAVRPLAGATLERADGTRAVPGPPTPYILP